MLTPCPAEDSGGSKKMNLSLYGCVFGANGKNLARNPHDEVDRAFDAGTYQQILAKGMMLPIDLEVPPGGNQLRLAVSTTRQDSSALSATRLDNRLCRGRPAGSKRIRKARHQPGLVKSDRKSVV